MRGEHELDDGEGGLVGGLRLEGEQAFGGDEGSGPDIEIDPAASRLVKHGDVVFEEMLAQIRDVAPGIGEADLGFGSHGYHEMFSTRAGAR